MSQIVINTGAYPNDGTGDPLRTAFTEVNNNFTQLFAAGPVDSNIQIVGNQIKTTNTNGNLNLVPNGIGSIVVNASIVPDISGIRNIGTVTKPFNEIFVNYASVANLVINDLIVPGNLTVNGNIFGNLTGTTTGTHNGLVYDIDIRWMVWDFAYIQPNTYTNPIQYLLDNAPPVDMGTILAPADLNIDTGFF